MAWRASALGFGCARLPIVGDKHGEIDEAQAIEMIHYAIDHGVTYLDTAYNYREGNSERFLGRALQHGYRDRANWRPSCPAG